MASVGPELPLHLTENRKRQLDEDERKTSNYTPSPPADPRSRTPNSNPNKRSRTIGPSLPPTPLSERPSTPPSPTASASSSDSDFGPSLPPASSAALPAIPDPQHTAQVLPPDQTPQKPQRDEWMLVPPSNSDWSSRVDPTKLKNRTFQTGKGAKAPLPKGGGGDSTWTETLEQKKKRLEDEVMGAKQPAQLDAREGEDWKARLEDEDTRRRIREYDASTLFARLLLLKKNRGGSLYQAHQQSTPKEKEDDPSKRAFDREKDIAGGVKIGHAQKREILNRAKDFGSRFSGGSYL